MTALAQRIKETPMAPYMGVMQSLSRKDIDIVVTFLNEVKASVPTRAGWAAAAKQAHADGEDKLIAADVFEDETGHRRFGVRFSKKREQPPVR